MTRASATADRFCRWLVDRAGTVAIAGLIACIAAGLGMTQLRLETDDSIFFDDDNPNYIAEKALQRDYGRTDNVMFVIAPDSGSVFTPRAADLLHRLTDEGWRIPYARRVDSLANYQHTEASDDELRVADLIPVDEDLTPERLDAIREIALSEPELVYRWVSPSGHVAAVNVFLNMPEDDTFAVPEIAGYARDLKAQLAAEYPDVDLYLLGSAVGDQTFDELSINDFYRFIPIVVVIVITILTLALRSVSATIAILAVVATSIVATLGLAGYLGFRLNAATVAVPSIVMTLAVADAVHMLSIFLARYRGGEARDASIFAALRMNLQPILLTTLTTGIGFLGLNYSEVPPFRDLGNIVAFGVVMALLSTLAFLPWLLRVLPFRQVSHKSEQLMTQLADTLIARRRVLGLGAAAVAVVIVSFAPRNSLEDDFIEYFSTDLPLRQAADFTIDNLTGPFVMSFSFDSGRPNGVTDPEYLKQVERFMDWAREQPEVIYVAGFTETLKRLNEDLHDDDPAWRVLPDSAELAAQYLLLYELSLPFGLDLNNQLSFDKSKMRIDVRIGGERTSGIVDLEARANAWLAENTPDIATVGAGADVSWANIGQRNINAMLTGSLIALGLITITLTLTLQSLKFGLMSLIPNLLPAAIAFGIWGLLVGHINLAAAVVFSMTIGIVVDDTVYLLTKYLHARRVLGRTPEQAMHYAIATVARALIVTSITLTAGFLVLATSDFNLNVTSGVMIAIVVSSAVIYDLLMLPALVVWLDERFGARTDPAIEAHSPH
ncbi:MAG: efflux RND transporter permease subunit [Pseudomonadota bacterium]